MNDHATQVLNATAAGQEVMAENDNLWTGKTAVENKMAAMEVKVGQIELIDDQINNGGGASTLKKLAKENAAVKALRIAKPLAIFAKDTNDLELFAEIDFEWADLRYGKDQDSIDRWRLVHEHSLPLDATLIADGYIETGWVGALLLAITDFETQRGKPVAKRANVKGLNQQLNLRIKELVEIKTDLVDLLVQFKESNPEFYTAVKSAFEIDMTGVRHLALRIRFTDEATGVRLPKVTATIVETGLTKTSSSKGVIEFTRQELAQGNYVLQSSLNNYDLSEIPNIGINHAELVTLEIEMVKKSGSGTATGNIGGTVRQMGMPAANATVSVQGQPISTTTDAMGNYQLVGVNAGNQNVTVNVLSAAQPPQTKQVVVVAGQTASCNFDF
ncbi:MAG: carboxypeptidase regulatory-like domain-containing protein [Flavobacteriales bacterium]|nr:carboxypeptidase regulatory-like domain-containing protein [Flavobacteriales bacterium]